MLIKKLIAITLLSAFLLTEAQTPSVTWTELNQPSYGFFNNFYGFIGEDEGNTFYFQYWELVKLDPQNKVLAAKEIAPIAGISKMYFYPRFFLLEGTLWMMVNAGYDKETKATHV